MIAQMFYHKSMPIDFPQLVEMHHRENQKQKKRKMLDMTIKNAVDKINIKATSKLLINLILQMTLTIIIYVKK